MRIRTGFVSRTSLLLLLVIGGACASPVADVGADGEELRLGPDFPFADLPEPIVGDPIDPDPAPELPEPPSEIAPEQPAAAPFADLVSDGSIRYINYGSAYDLQVNVVNTGTANTQGAAARISINGQIFDTTLYHYWDGTYDHSNIVFPGQRGYFIVKNYPMNVKLAPCQPASVEIDLDHVLQYGDGSGNAPSNDAGTALFYETGASCPLTWTTQINAATVGLEPDSVAKTDHGTGWSLQSIVSSYVSGRPDGLRCSNAGCHNASQTKIGMYAPNVAPGEISREPILPNVPVSGGQAWIGGDDPWLPKFLAYPGKPDYLKAAFTKWVNDGAQL